MMDRRASILATVAILVTAALVALGDALSAVNADNLIPALMSTQKLTPFYWGDAARIGSLVPALTSFITNPVANWTVQCAISSAAGLGCFLLAPAFVFGGAAWRVIGPAAALVWVLAVSKHVLVGWLAPGQPYGVALALGLAALLLVELREPLRWYLVVLLLLVAFWCDSGLGLVLAPLWLARQVIRRWSSAELAPFLVVLLIQASWMIYYRVADTEPLYLGHVPLAKLPAAVGSAVNGAFGEAGWSWGLAVLGLLAATICLASAERLRRAGLLVLAAVASALPVACNAWVSANGHSARYYLPSMALLTCAACAALPDALALSRLLLLALPLAAVLRFGAPSAFGVRAQLAAMAPAAAQVDARGCTSVAGDYWATWPVVLEVLELRRERGSALPLYGITTRGEVLFPAAAAQPGAVNCRLGF